MRSHSVTFHPTQVNTPRLNSSQRGRYLTYLPRRDGRLSLPAILSCSINGTLSYLRVTLAYLRVTLAYLRVTHVTLLYKHVAV